MITKKTASDYANKYYNDIYSFCCSRLNNIEDANDVTQDVFLFFQEKLQTLDDVNIRSWLFYVANKKILEEYRERSIRSNIIPLSDEISSEYTEPLYEFDDYCYVDNDVINRTKEKILSKLTPTEQELFLKIYENRKKYSEIANELNISEKAVNVRSYRLREKIKDMAEIAFMLLIYSFVKLK